MFIHFLILIFGKRVKYGLADMVVNMIMQGLDLSVVHFLCPLCNVAHRLKTVDAGSNPAGHIQLLMLFKKGINMALDKTLL